MQRKHLRVLSFFSAICKNESETAELLKMKMDDELIKIIQIILDWLFPLNSLRFFFFLNLDQPECLFFLLRGTLMHANRMSVIKQAQSDVSGFDNLSVQVWELHLCHNVKFNLLLECHYKIHNWLTRYSPPPVGYGWLTGVVINFYNKSDRLLCWIMLPIH